MYMSERAKHSKHAGAAKLLSELTSVGGALSPSIMLVGKMLKPFTQQHWGNFSQMGWGAHT